MPREGLALKQFQTAIDVRLCSQYDSHEYALFWYCAKNIFTFWLLSLSLSQYYQTLFFMERNWKLIVIQIICPQWPQCLRCVLSRITRAVESWVRILLEE